ncbi:cohesin domain-containing protein [Cellulosimicrobium sp. Marseille-Q4280]|uniref:cohesin domain-containing protein n=1 Tax=Cellulosimicrobium sp. Marseille-Q4280 TaxID=2937992 RepID=UPI00203FBD1D|nr:cohesin domain-containing protein [Cellulosimicrobium sp. Marseille-Q4280]
MTHTPTRRRARRRATFVGGLTLAASLLTAQAAQAAPSVADVTVDAPATVEAGEPVEVTVAVTGAADVYAYDLAVAYDPELVEYVEDSAVTPDGGFSDATDDGAGTVAVAHTRLGTSPGLDGDVTLATLTFTALAAGDAIFDVPVVTFVGTDEETVTLEDAGTATTTVTAVPVPTDEPGETTPPTDPGTTDPGTTPTDDDATSDPTSPATSGTGGTGGGGPGGPLASTGASVAAIVAGAVLAIATGVGILVARRRAVASR